MIADEMKNVILQGDSLEVLKGFPDCSIDCCVTSPPYYGLRDYGTGKWVGGDPNCPHKNKTITGYTQKELVGNDGDAIFKIVCPLCGAVREDKQIGLEETPEQYIQRLVDVFREVRRALKDDGTLWVNIGDSYCNSNGFARASDEFQRKGRDAAPANDRNLSSLHNSGLKTKDLIGIPWMLAFALRNDGWYLRQDIIWHKPNPMPESVKDRCTKAHEYIFLLSKSPQYYFDYLEIQEVATSGEQVRDKHAEGYQADYAKGDRFSAGEHVYGKNGMRNKRDVWSIPVSPSRDAHFATFPESLIKPCITAGCRVGGIVLDPFFGSGTTGRVAQTLNRNYIGIELNPKYVELATRRNDNIQMSFIGIL